MSTLVKSGKKVLSQPGFLVAFIVLLVSSIGLNATAKFLKLHFKKQPVPLIHSLETIPQVLGDWVCVSKDQLSDDIEQELGTNKYIMRYYVNSSVIRKEDIALFEGKSSKEVMGLTGDMHRKYKDFDLAFLSFAVTYYTGKADTVAHIPERCYTADGYEPTATTDEPWNLPTTKYSTPVRDVRYISFEDQSGKSRVTRNVAYFFNVNGDYTSQPLEVRYKLQNLFQRYGYYSKIELMIQDPRREESAAAIKNFLKFALPEVENCLPDFKGKYESLNNQ